MVTALFFFYSPPSEQEVPFSTHLPWRFNLVNLITDKFIESYPIAFKLCFKNSNFSNYQVLTEFYSHLPGLLPL